MAQQMPGYATRCLSHPCVTSTPTACFRQQLPCHTHIQHPHPAATAKITKYVRSTANFDHKINLTHPGHVHTHRLLAAAGAQLLAVLHQAWDDLRGQIERGKQELGWDGRLLAVLHRAGDDLQQYAVDTNTCSAGWVALKKEQAGLQFRLTPAGKASVAPSTPTPTPSDVQSGFAQELSTPSTV